MTMTATSGCLLGRAGTLEWKTENLRALLSVLHQQLLARGEEEDDEARAILNLMVLGRARCEGLDQVARELREIADDLSRQERARAKKAGEF